MVHLQFPGLLSKHAELLCLIKKASALLVCPPPQMQWRKGFIKLRMIPVFLLLCTIKLRVNGENAACFKWTMWTERRMQPHLARIIWKLKHVSLGSSGEALLLKGESVRTVTCLVKCVCVSADLLWKIIFFLSVGFLSTNGDLLWWVSQI